MDLYHIPLRAVANQRVNCQIDGQELEITLHTRLDKRLYISIKCNKQPIVYNRICQNLTPLIDVDYLPIKGVLFFRDSLGNQDPDCKELGKRYRLYWGG